MIVVCWPVCDKETQSLCLRAELICNTCIYMISFCVIVFIEQFPDYLVIRLYMLKVVTFASPVLGLFRALCYGPLCRIKRLVC